MIAATGLIFGATKVWWYVSRSTGIVAWSLLALSVLWGLALSTRALGRRPPAPWLLDVHRFLGGLAVIFTLFHLVSLMLDPFAAFKLNELLIPFSSRWKPGPVAWGIAAFYLLLAVELTSLMKKRLPIRFWRGVHLTSYVLYAFATVHLLTAGTDRLNPILRWSVLATVGAVVFFTMYRVIGPGRAASVKTSGSPRKDARNRGGDDEGVVTPIDREGRRRTG
jgi:DMSO/TMAO reductase YedYZ heme-binding membrane subunit